MCLQNTNLSRTSIGFLVPVLSDRRLKTSDLIQPSFHPFCPASLSPALAGQQNEKAAAGPTDSRQSGADCIKYVEEILAELYLTRRQREAISPATNTYFSPATAFYHSTFNLELILRYQNTWRCGESNKKKKKGEDWPNQMLPECSV